MHLKLGTYTGNGTSIAITGVGFTPDIVIVKADATQSAIFTSKTMPLGNSITFRDNASLITTGITSLDGDGFSVGSSTLVNLNATTYYYAAFKSFNSGALFFGGDRGTGSAHSITLPINTTPKLILGKTASTSSGIWRTDQNTAGTALNFFGGAGQTTDLLSFSAGSVSVGTGSESNSSGNIYHYFGMGSAPTFFTTGSYVGNGTATSITLPFVPAMLFLGTETNGAGGAIIWFNTMPLNRTGTFDATALSTGNVTSVSGKTINLGNAGRVNQNGTTYKYAAWAQPPTGRVAVNLPRLATT